MFRDNEHQLRYNLFASQKCLPGRNVDLSFVKMHFRTLYDHLAFQKLETLLELKNPYYPNLIQVWYSGIESQSMNVDIATFVKGKDINVTEEVLGNLLDLYADGEDIKDQGSSSYVAGYNRLEALNLVCNRAINFEPGKVRTSDLMLEMRILHLIVVHSIYPKSGSYTEVGSFELLIMWMIISRRQIFFPALILRKMHSIADSGRGSLLYGMLISRLMHHFDVSISDETVKNIAPTDILDERTMSRMHYQLIDQRWVSRHQAAANDPADEDEEAEEAEEAADIPEDMLADVGPSTSARRITLEDIMTSMHDGLRDLRQHFDTRFDSLDSRVGNLESQIAELHVDLEDIKDHLDHED